jgi:hypothetical protein
LNNRHTNIAPSIEKSWPGFTCNPRHPAFGGICVTPNFTLAMKHRHVFAFAALLLAACSPQGGFAPDDTATMPLAATGGPALTQGDAIGLTGWAFIDPANTAGNPERGARAVAAEDWLAGQTMLYGNFGSYSPGGELSWAQFRQQVRAAVGVAPDARSQEVVDRLLATADALAKGDAVAAKAQLASPVFTLGPDATLQALGHLPRMPGAEWALAELRRNTNSGGGGPGR